LIHPINQSPTVLLHHASELIQDVLEDRLLDNESLLSAWVERATVWSKDYGAYLNRENGDVS
jgi:hypothetical protein